MRRFESASVAFLVLMASCQGRELLGAKMQKNLHAMLHKQEATDKVAELEKKVDILMEAFIAQQEINKDLNDKVVSLTAEIANGSIPSDLTD